MSVLAFREERKVLLIFAPKFKQMKRVLAIVFLALFVVAAWWLFFKKDKPATQEEQVTNEAIKVKKHSDEFNAGIDRMLNSYFAMKDAFVEADTAAVRPAALKFLADVDQVPLEELNQDDPKISAVASQQISDIKANAEPIIAETDITEMRHDFHMVSENLYPFLKTIGYEGEKIYWQNCPMAFNDDIPANWLSETREIVNPYLGKKDPKYKAGMLNCGEVKDSIY